MNMITRYACLMIAPLLLGACAMQNNSFLSNEPLTVEDEHVSVTMASDNVNRNVLDELANEIGRRGKGEVHVTVHYVLRQPYKDTQRVANAQGQRVKSYLSRQGVKRPILVLTEPDLDYGANKIEIGFNALKANAPKNCLDITHGDADRYDFGKDSGYYYGCTGDTYLSRMIARPGDLLGNETTSHADSQRLGKGQETYRSGERATAREDEGLSASSVYSR